MKEAAKRLQKVLRCQHVMIKGGHLPKTDQEQVPDVLYDGINDSFHVFEAQRITYKFEEIEITNWHGSGCALSSSIISNMANGKIVSEAVNQAKHYVAEAMKRSYLIGKSKMTAQLNHDMPTDYRS